MLQGLVSHKSDITYFQSHPENLEQHALVQGHHLEKVRRGHYWKPTQQLSKTVTLGPGPLLLATSNCHQLDNSRQIFRVTKTTSRDVTEEGSRGW